MFLGVGRGSSNELHNVKVSQVEDIVQGSMTDQEITSAALQEVKSPTWAMTEQFFEIHALKEEDPIALIEYVQDETSSNPVWRVYLNLQDVHYYFQIGFESQQDSLRVVGCNSSEHASVRLNIHSNIDSPDRIEQTLELPASYKGYRGEHIHPKSLKVRDNHVYSFKAKAPNAWTFDRKLERLLDDLILVKQQLKEVHERSTSCIINVSYAAWQSQMWGCHLSVNTIQKLNSLDIALDIDLYAEGPELL